MLRYCVFDGNNMTIAFGKRENIENLNHCVSALNIRRRTKNPKKLQTREKSLFGLIKNIYTRLLRVAINDCNAYTNLTNTLF